MYEIDFEIAAELVGVDLDEFMNDIDAKLYGKYHGDASLAVCNDKPVIHGTVEAKLDNWVEALIPIVRERSTLGAYSKEIRQTNLLSLA